MTNRWETPGSAFATFWYLLGHKGSWRNPIHKNDFLRAVYCKTAMLKLLKVERLHTCVTCTVLVLTLHYIIGINKFRSFFLAGLLCTSLFSYILFLFSFFNDPLPRHSQQPWKVLPKMFSGPAWHSPISVHIKIRLTAERTWTNTNKRANCQSGHTWFFSLSNHGEGRVVLL